MQNNIETTRRKIKSGYEKTKFVESIRLICNGANRKQHMLKGERNKEIREREQTEEKEATKSASQGWINEAAESEIDAGVPFCVHVILWRRQFLVIPHFRALCSTTITFVISWNFCSDFLLFTSSSFDSPFVFWVICRNASQIGTACFPFFFCSFFFSTYSIHR